MKPRQYFTISAAPNFSAPKQRVLPLALQRDGRIEEVRYVNDMMTQVKEAASCLDAGGVILVPTDTVYGLAVLPEHDDAIAKLFEIKGRPRSRNLPVMTTSVEEIVALGAVVNESAQKLIASSRMPGPVTLALEVSAQHAVAWLRGRIEVAVRMPDDERLRSLISIVGPLLVTSANLHSEQTYESVPEILASLRGTPDFVIDDGPRDVVPSTLINCRLAPPVIERVGVVAEKEIEAILR
jgi:L-threonylcarbamoyladenylate synthase